MLVTLVEIGGQVLVQAVPTHGGRHLRFGRGGLLELRAKQIMSLLKWTGLMYPKQRCVHVCVCVCVWSPVKGGGFVKHAIPIAKFSPP
jgi:hypothetical protein